MCAKMKKVESLTINNTREEWELAFEWFLKERFHRSSIDKLRNDKDSFDLLFKSFLAWRKLWVKWIQQELHKYEVYEK